MGGNHTISHDRQRTAREALSALGPARADHERLSVQCRRSHHVATVFDTDAGPVLWTRTGPHAHGSKDFVDTGHHASGPAETVDLLEPAPMGDDVVPSWCDCGPVELSRAALLDQLKSADRTVRLG